MKVFIRSIGERTTKKCAAILKEHDPEIVGAHPFSETIRLCFEKAIESGVERMICIDADVLPGPLMVSEMDWELRRDDQRFAVTCQLQDKLLNKIRTVGVHAYNVKYLKHALKYIDVSKFAIRPEKFIREKMMQEGLRVFRRKGSLGRHGFEQYYKDIYRVSRVMAIKFPKSGRHNLDRWKELQNQDLDYRVALAGWDAGKKADPDSIKIDASIDLKIDKVLMSLGVEEKDELC